MRNGASSDKDQISQDLSRDMAVNNTKWQKQQCAVSNSCKIMYQQDCILVGCVPPARWPYLVACSAPGGGGGVCSRGVSAPWGVSAHGGCLLPGGLLTGGGGCLLPGGSAPGGCSRGCLLRGGCLLPGEGWRWYPSMHWGRPPVNRITHTCKNITLPQLRCGR